MSAKLRRSLTLALLTVSLGVAGTQAPASAASLTPATEPPPGTPVQSCSISLLIVSGVDPCKILGSLQEVAAYGLEDFGVNALQGALSGVNLTNICLRGSHPKPAPASVINACPVLGG
ncbi:MAG TPA: hypothetical protein VHV82_13910 [Sporichthyaceae bacterium]|jgi:hypothetical protein|nr:hypothetical protein [Sporichthyaceae bacterium]